MKKKQIFCAHHWDLNPEPSLSNKHIQHKTEFISQKCHPFSLLLRKSRFKRSFSLTSSAWTLSASRYLATSASSSFRRRSISALCFFSSSASLKFYIFHESLFKTFLLLFVHFHQFSMRIVGMDLNHKINPLFK